MAKHTRFFTSIAATALLSAGLAGHAGADEGPEGPPFHAGPGIVAR